MFRTVISLFHGMGCFNIAAERAGVEFQKCYTSEIDPYASIVDKANNPGNVNMGDVTKWRDWPINWWEVDLVVGGSPCQGFSAAGKQGGTKAILDGMEIIVSDRAMYLDAKSRGAEFLSQSYLFWEYVLLIDFIKLFNPNVKVFLENVNMSKNNMDMITDAMGVKPVFINSALVSAQNRRRWYWANWEFDQPEDKHIYLRDILESDLSSDRIGMAVRDKLKTIRIGGRNSPIGSRHEWDSPFLKCDKQLNLKNNQNKASCLTGGGNSGGNHSDMDILVYPASIVGRRIDPETNRRSDNDASVPIVQCLQVKHSPDKMGCLTTVAKDTLISTEAPGRYVDAYNNSDLQYRRLTIMECERLQTVPDGYTQNKGVSNSQCYKMLGNGWTVDVIAHILKGVIE